MMESASRRLVKERSGMRCEYCRMELILENVAEWWRGFCNLQLRELPKAAMEVERGCVRASRER